MRIAESAQPSNAFLIIMGGVWERDYPYRGAAIKKTWRNAVFTPGKSSLSRFRSPTEGLPPETASFTSTPSPGGKLFLRVALQLLDFLNIAWLVVLQIS